MGRNAGFLPMDASIASRSVNVCLIPEFPFDLFGPRGLLEYTYQRLKVKGTSVIVISDGAC
jgi:6-phosphofructokinase 1